jgi:hypothetical protein
MIISQNICKYLLRVSSQVSCASLPPVSQDEKLTDTLSIASAAPFDLVLFAEFGFDDCSKLRARREAKWGVDFQVRQTAMHDA